MRGDRLKLATYNVKDLFLNGEGPVKPGKALRPLARMIDQVGADLIALQEVGSEQSLAALNERLTRPYAFARFARGNSERSIGLAVLSRVAVAVTSYADLALRDSEGSVMQAYADETSARAGITSPLRFQRDVMRLEYDLPGSCGVSTETNGSLRVAVFVVHLKSRTNRPWQTLSADDIRSAEIRALAWAVREYAQQHPNRQILVMGDCNDQFSSDAMAPLRALGLRDPVGEAVRQAGRNPSTYWPKRRMRIDHILLWPPRGRVRVHNPTIHANNMARTASDHYPVSIELHWAQD